MNPATSAPQGKPQPGAAQRRIVLSFCVTVLLGVLLSAGYLVSGAGRTAARAATTNVGQTRVVLSPGNPPNSLPVSAPPGAAAVEPVAPIQAKQKESPAKESKPATIGATYLQIAAVDRGVAEVYVEVLRRKGFHTLIANGPTTDIFRVLVGPVKDTASLARTKADLQAQGFTSFARKLNSE